MWRKVNKIRVDRPKTVAFSPTKSLLCENFCPTQNRSMKNVAIAFLVVIVASIFLSSCKSKERCAAYGEANKYQIERRR